MATRAVDVVAATTIPKPKSMAAQTALVRIWTTGTAIICGALVLLMLLFLFAFAWPAIKYNGWTMLTSIYWNIGDQYATGTTVHNGVAAQPGANFGSLVFIYGTLMTSILAMLGAVPLSLLVAFALVYRIPARIRPGVNALVELMAGVPSVVYGLWGVVVLVPFIGQQLAPFVTSHLSGVPFVGGAAGSGNGLFASAVILALMVTPIMVATMRDVMLAQSKALYEASVALGSTSWQAVTRVVVPSVRNGVFASVLLAFGRALGETMAVLMVCGAAANEFPSNIFQTVNTIAAIIVSQLESASTDASGIAQRSLAELALILFVITLTINIIARLIMRGTDRLGKSNA